MLWQFYKISIFLCLALSSSWSTPALPPPPPSLTHCCHCLHQLKIALCEIDGFLQAWNYSSHLPVIPPFHFGGCTGRVPVFFVLPASLSIKNNYGIILLLSTFHPPSPPPPVLSRSLQFLRLTVYGTVINGWWVYRLSFSRSVSGCECVCVCTWRIWSGMERDGLAVCSICIQSFSEGRLLWRFV